MVLHFTFTFRRKRNYGNGQRNNGALKNLQIRNFWSLCSPECICLAVYVLILLYEIDKL